MPGLAVAGLAGGCRCGVGRAACPRAGGTWRCWLPHGHTAMPMSLHPMAQPHRAFGSLCAHTHTNTHLLAHSHPPQCTQAESPPMPMPRWWWPRPGAANKAFVCQVTPHCSVTLWPPNLSPPQCPCTQKSLLPFWLAAAGPRNLNGHTVSPEAPSHRPVPGPGCIHPGQSRVLDLLSPHKLRGSGPAWPEGCRQGLGVTHQALHTRRGWHGCDMDTVTLVAVDTVTVVAVPTRRQRAHRARPPGLCQGHQRCPFPRCRCRGWQVTEGLRSSSRHQPHDCHSRLWPSRWHLGWSRPAGRQGPPRP